MKTTIVTRVGMAGWGDNRFRGRSVRDQLLGSTSLSQLLALAIGVELSCEEAEFLDEIAVAVTLADPHIWPVKLTRVVGAYGGSPMPGMVAGVLATDGVGLGPGSVRPAATWLSGLAAGDRRPGSVTEEVRARLDRSERLPGFGVPARPVDERVEMIAACVQARGRGHLRHWATWQEVVTETRRRKLEPNIASGFSAAALDLGFKTDHVVVVAHLSAMACFLSNAVEGAAEPSELLQSVPRALLDYRGPARRRSSRAMNPADRPEIVPFDT
jgi:hypothetical protein